MSAKQIVIITDPAHRDLWHSTYAVRALAERWQTSGYRVRVLAGTGERVPADIAFLHVDLTAVPKRYLDFARNYPIVINGHCRSISKELFSTQMLTRGSDYKGEVIVKTRANSGGIADLKYRDYHENAGAGPRTLARRLPGYSAGRNWLETRCWRTLKKIKTDRYPVYASIDAVPAGVWKNPGLIVEKFLPERDTEGRYLMRGWYFFGDKSAHDVTFSRLPVVKFPTTPEAIALSEQRLRDPDLQKTPIPQTLTAVREQLRMDFGRIDWVMHEGQPVVLDANKTPAGVGRQSADPAINRITESLVKNVAEGIRCFIA